MLLAKSNPKETLVEHTRELMERYTQLSTAYKETISIPKVWELLRLAALYHDTGKAYTYFQYTIKKALGYEVKKSHLVPIPHNYLSPFFLPLDILKLNKHHRRILIQAIAYHHEREVTPETSQLLEVAQTNLLPQFQHVKNQLTEFGVEVPKDSTYFPRIASDIQRRIKENIEDNHYLTYVIVKGLLHRLDHAASAHVNIEIDGDFDLSALADNYLQKLTGKQSGYLRTLQRFALENQKNNVILTAQTGMGKTEAALLWAGKKKTFFTLPLRVSLNALYDRVSTEMGYGRCGLLHASSAHHLDEKGIENWEAIYDQSKHFSNKIIFTTIDQILKFPFKFRGYEKYYATLAHSCVVIDEIQAYSPWIVAVMIKALEMIHNIGGKFMIMTATLPNVYLEALREKGVIDDHCVVRTFFDDSLLRHRFTLEDRAIIEDVSQIVEAGKRKKVLVIANTVNQANALYEQIVNRLNDSRMNDVYLLHSRFLQNDRQLLEQRLKAFDEDRNKAGIWITTQIVEASMDIDFDELYTELAPLDSLFQRFGRCYRKRVLKTEEANIRIFTKETSGKGYIYDREIIEKSEKFLRQHAADHGSEIKESQKMKMVEHLYSRKTLEGTEFYDKFQQALKELDHIEDYQISFSEAQKTLRGDNSVTIIPRKTYDHIIPLFEQLETEVNQSRRIEIRREIERYTCTVSKRMFKDALSPIDHYRQTKNGKYPLMSHIYILDRDYEFDRECLKGVGIKNENPGFEVL